MDSFLALAQGRRSVRRYTPEPVARAALDRILEAGRIAPSGNNSQPWHFIVARDAGVRQRLAEVSGKQLWMLEAPVIVAVVADLTAKLRAGQEERLIRADDPEHMTALAKCVRDATIAADHMVLAAADEGLGSCWVALFEQPEIRAALGVPEHCYVVTLITIGHPAEEPAAKPRRLLEEIVFHEQFGAR